MTKLIDYAMQFVGVQYLWGGNHPCSGFDCSGYIQELLSSIGLDPQGDQTAQGLYDHFSKDENGYAAVGQRGALCFYGKSDKEIIHIAFMIDDNRIIEAGGGGSSVIDLQSAIKKKAFIRIRPSTHRNDLASIIMPKYPSWILE